MKFTKEQGFEQIKSLLGQTQTMTDRSINEQLDTLIPLIATEEMELSDFIAKVSPSFKTMDLNVKHEKSLFHKPAEPQPAPVQAPAAAITPEVKTDGLTLEAITAAISAAVTPLSSELAALKNKSHNENIVASAKDLFMNLKPDPARQSAIDLAFNLSTGSIQEGATPESLFEAIKTNYDTIVSASGATNAYIPLESQGGVDGGNSGLKSRLAAIEAKEVSEKAASLGVKGALGLATEQIKN